MSRDRFLHIFWMLHVGDGQQRFDKIKLLCEALLANFQGHYYPSQSVAVDETMVGFRGPKQYMSSKPTKYGIKAFTLANSDHSYMLNILLYTGDDTLSPADPQYSQLPQPARIVMHLMQPYLHKGHMFTQTTITAVYLSHRHCWRREPGTRNHDEEQGRSS